MQSYLKKNKEYINMGWFSKNKEKEQEISKLPTLNSGINDFPTLADLPEVPQKQEFKSLPPLKQEKKEPIKEALGLDHNHFVASAGPHTRPMDLPPEPPEYTAATQIKKTRDPIYIRLDKFESTFGSFKEVQEKIKQVEEYLLKLKELKEKEEAELGEWEKELQLIKTRIDSIDKEIFDKLD
jgi:hypothetical protein